MSRDDYDEEEAEGALEDRAIEAAEHAERTPDEPDWAGATATHCPDGEEHLWSFVDGACSRCHMPNRGPF